MKKNTDQKYFEMSYVHRKGGAAVEFMSNQEHCWDISIGRKLAKVWPTDMSFRMDPERPKDVTLLDSISNLEKVLLASPKLREFLRAQSLPEAEFLPVTILDHKGRVASKDYSIVNCLRVVDCVDQQRSVFRWDGLDEPSMIVSVMALSAATLGDADTMIRPKFVPGRVLYREDLMRAILQQRFSGVAFSREVFGDPEVYLAEN